MYGGAGGTPVCFYCFVCVHLSLPLGCGAAMEALERQTRGAAWTFSLMSAIPLPRWNPSLGPLPSTMSWTLGCGAMEAFVGQTRGGRGLFPDDRDLLAELRHHLLGNFASWTPSVGLGALWPLVLCSLLLSGVANEGRM